MYLVSNKTKVYQTFLSVVHSPNFLFAPLFCARKCRHRIRFERKKGEEEKKTPITDEDVDRNMQAEGKEGAWTADVKIPLQISTGCGDLRIS